MLQCAVYKLYKFVKKCLKCFFFSDLEHHFLVVDLYQNVGTDLKYFCHTDDVTLNVDVIKKSGKFSAAGADARNGTKKMQIN